MWIREAKRGDKFNKIPDIKALYIFAGIEHTAVIDLDNYVWLRGSNNYGQLGSSGLGLFFKKMTHNIKAKQISLGAYHTIILGMDNTVGTFGMNRCGQLGRITNGNCYQLHPGKYINIKTIQIAAGWFHTVILDINNDIWVSGLNDYGQLGLNHTENIFEMTQIHNIKAKSITAGYYNTAIIDLDNNVWICGGNTHGQLGLGYKTSYSSSPFVQIPGIKASQIAL